MTAKLAVWIGAAALLVIAIGLVAHGLRQSGREDERQAITHQNTEAGNAGETARLSRSDCVARRLQYDFETRRCVGNR